MFDNKKTSNCSPSSEPSHPMMHESLSREEAVRILRSTAEYLEGRADIAVSAAAEYRLRTLAAQYRMQEHSTEAQTEDDD